MKLPDGVKPRSVTILTNAIRLRLEEHFADVWVFGELKNTKRAPERGYYTFSVIDSHSQLRCYLPAGVALRMKFDLRDGMQVLMYGSISVNNQYGQYQLEVKELEPRGIGADELALRQLKEKLSAKGYFDPRRKRKLPPFPQYVAIVTSKAGAVIHDMLRVFKERWPATGILVYPCRVQGEHAAAEIAGNLAVLNRLSEKKRIPLDAIIIGRGGGAGTDLTAFNEECLADAIYFSKVPVVAAIGHETDVSIADLVADLRAPTPSAAAAAITPNRLEELRHVRKMTSDLTEIMEQRIQDGRGQLARITSRPVFRNPMERFRRAGRDVDSLSQRCQRSMLQNIARHRELLRSISERLAALNPLAVLGRGYSLTKGPAGQLLREARTVNPGDTITTHLQHGSLVSQVIEIKE